MAMLSAAMTALCQGASRETRTRRQRRGEGCWGDAKVILVIHASAEEEICRCRVKSIHLD